MEPQAFPNSYCLESSILICCLGREANCQSSICLCLWGLFIMARGSSKDKTVKFLKSWVCSLTVRQYLQNICHLESTPPILIVAAIAAKIHWPSELWGFFKIFDALYIFDHASWLPDLKLQASAKLLIFIWL